LVPFTAGTVARRRQSSHDLAKLREGSMAKGILIAAMDFQAGREDEFHDWYDLEHVSGRHPARRQSALG
jgi:hypothetical protein